MITTIVTIAGWVCEGGGSDYFDNTSTGIVDPKATSCKHVCFLSL